MYCNNDVIPCVLCNPQVFLCCLTMRGVPEMYSATVAAATQHVLRQSQ